MTIPSFYLSDTAPAPFVAAVIATSCLHPLHERHKVEAELARRGVRGDVLFDHLLSTASATRRYFVLPFDGIALGHPSTPLESSVELEAWSRRVFSACPDPLDTILLLSETARACFPEHVSLRGVGSSALHDALQDLAGRRQLDFDQVAHELAAEGFEQFEDRVFYESPKKVLAEYDTALARWPGQDTAQWFVNLDKGQMIRLRLAARENGRSSSEFALMCLAWALKRALVIDKKFWNGTRWMGHLAFQTVSHAHVCCYAPAEGRDTCDIMVVECEDGRFYVEDNWGGDANGAEGVWNPFDPSDAEPRFFRSEEAAIRHAVTVVASVSGVPEADLLTAYGLGGSAR